MIIYFRQDVLGRIVLPAKLIPTTGHVTRVVFGTREEVRVQQVDRHVATCRLDHLDAFASLNRDGAAREDVETIEVAVHCPFLKGGLVLVDTPGVSDQEAQTRRASSAIATADLVLMMLDARQLLSSQERYLATEWLGTHLGKPVGIVVNFMNFLTPHEQREVRSRLERWCRARVRSDLGQPWFEVNALGALRHAIGEAEAPTDDFAVLRTTLAACHGHSRQQLQRQSRWGQVLAEVRAAQARNTQVLERIRVDAAQVEYERAVVRQDLEDMRRHVRAQARTLRERLCMFAQQALAESLTALTSHYTGKSKEELEGKANDWFQAQWFTAIRTIDKEANGALLSLTEKELRPPEPLTIEERFILNARIHIGDLPNVEASDAAVGWGVGSGAVLGTFLLPIPVLGTVAGGIIGGILGNILGKTAPDYGAAYADKAREQWETSTHEVLAILQAQYDARIRELQSQIDDQLAQNSQDKQPLEVELRQREEFAEVLARIVYQLQAA
jgi:hypothetical protein